MTSSKIICFAFVVSCLVYTNYATTVHEELINEAPNVPALDGVVIQAENEVEAVRKVRQLLGLQIGVGSPYPYNSYGGYGISFK